MKNQMIFQQQQQRQFQAQFGLSQKVPPRQRANLFDLSQEERVSINKHLPRGFCLIRKQQYDRITFKKAPQLSTINYDPKKVQRVSDIDNPILKTIEKIWSKKQQQLKKSNKQSPQFTMEGRSRQSEKIKNIIQRFRKLIKNTAVQSYLNKVGLMLGLNEIQGQNKKGLLTIDTFKARWMLVIQTAKATTFQTDVIVQIDEMIQEFMCYVEQARKAEFQNNILSIQKSIDKITRYLSDSADGKAQGNWYIRRKKKPERNQGYPQKQLLYFGELIQKLPTAYHVGIWQIINQKPFTEAERKRQQVNLSELSNKKIREIELYIKGKLSQMYRSRERKRQKMIKKQMLKQSCKQEQQQKVKIQKAQEIQINQKNVEDINDIDQLLQQIENKGDDGMEQFDQQGQFFFDIGDQMKLQNSMMMPVNQKQANKNKQQDNRSTADDDGSQIDLNEVSDSSIITDEDDSDF